MLVFKIIENTISIRCAPQINSKRFTKNKVVTIPDFEEPLLFWSKNY